MTASKNKPSSAPAREAHFDHLRAHEEHEQWARDLQRWRAEYEAAAKRLLRRLLPELDLIDFEDALDRHEAAILAHEELIDSHEQRMRRQRKKVEAASEEVEGLHELMHERHDRSSQDHEQLGQMVQAIVDALSQYDKGD